LTLEKILVELMTITKRTLQVSIKKGIKSPRITKRWGGLYLS